jgi:hypothetical protein
MESPALHPESPMDQEDIPYPCMGCGEILEEGKAFELCGFPHTGTFDVAVLTPPKLDRDGISTVSDAALAIVF